ELADRLADRHRRPDGRHDHYVRSLRDRDDLTLSTDLAWLDRLIAVESGHATEDDPS
ncbi:MAG: hypothetical protein QOD38_1688, partial [Acidimicrobiaceae bacterium]